MKLLLACLLLITTTNLSLQPRAAGDAALIDTVCGKTPSPDDCHVCFACNSGSAQMTVRELAGAAMYCTYNLSRVVQKAFQDLTTRSVDSTAKSIYRNCGARFDDFAGKLVQAMTSWSNRDYDSAKKEFDGARGDYGSCKDSLSKVTLPKDVKGDFEGVNNLYGDSSNIIQQSEAN